MADILVTGDDAPIIRGYIHEKGDTTARENLNGATVRFQMRRERDRRLIVDGLAQIESTASGTVAYTLAPHDTAIPGDYVYQWQVFYPDGKKQTTHALKELTIRRR